MIEISRDLEWVYRISPKDALLIERRKNSFGSRWCWYMHRDSKMETKIALLNLGKGTEDEGQGEQP